MDIAFQAAAAGGAIPDPVRPLEQTLPTAPGQPSPGGPSVLPMSQAYPTAAEQRPDVAGMIDRVRADFESFRLRLERQRDPQLVDQAPRDAIQQLDESMNRAIKTQVDILELGVTLNAGLTATQQSQNSVKTLLEKS